MRLIKLDVAMDVAARSCPDAQPKALDDLHWIVSGVGAACGQFQRGEMLADAELINKTFDQRHPWGCPLNR
jgi:hypothetical protein